jgi:4-hydroxymandelate synthase
MNVTTVDHVEFYVGDAEQFAQFLNTTFGFRCLGKGGPETGLAGQRTLLLGHGGIRLLVTSPLTPDHPVNRYLEEHGDGVACVAMATDDAAAAFAAAVREGARPVAEPHGESVVMATVSGTGVFTHRLVERHSNEFWPERIVPVAGEPATGDMLEIIDHLALCVGSGELEPTVSFYERVFGFREIFQERIEVGDQAMDSKVVQSLSHGVTITIVAPDPDTRGGQLNEFLQSNAGAGVQHLAMSTRDIATAVRAYGERGVRFLATPDSYYDGIAQRLGSVGLSIEALRAGKILVDRDHWGEMFQIFTESPFERRTFFFELIERHGALTFGTNNIRALYEAKERARAATTEAHLG